MPLDDSNRVRTVHWMVIVFPHGHVLFNHFYGQSCNQEQPASRINLK